VKKYKVILPIEVNGIIYPFGSIVELDEKTAIDYSHALTEVADSKPTEKELK
jgi:hypothetical protein